MTPYLLDSIDPLSKTLARFNDFDRANRFTSTCSPHIYRDDLFGPALAGNTFVCEPVHNLVHREVMTAKGTTFTVRLPRQAVCAAVHRRETLLEL